MVTTLGCEGGGLGVLPQLRRILQRLPLVGLHGRHSLACRRLRRLSKHVTT